MQTTVLRPSPFTNEHIRTFTEPADAASLGAAIERLRAAGVTSHPMWIGGRPVESGDWIASHNPARPSETVGRVAAATLGDAKTAVDAAALAFERWKRVSPRDRADVLFAAAERVRTRRDDFNALLVLEVGKPWVEADADTAEAIDFLEFYGREALRYAEPPPLVPAAGEDNRLAYIPLGVGVVVSPWNFAFAIMAGMTAAALVAGNTVVLKPSSDSPVVAAVFVELLREVGMPPDVVAFVPGSGRTIGDALVGHPKTRFIAFTGSKEVGLHVNELASKTAPGQKWIKRVVAEMGGKDAIVVAADADLDAAADGIVASAFGFSGQKCSACSRAIVDARVYDAVTAKIVERVARLRLGDPSEVAVDGAIAARRSDPRPNDPPRVAAREAAETSTEVGTNAVASGRAVDVGPVVNEGALRAMVSYVETALAEGGMLLAGGARAARDGWFLAPTVIGDVTPDATIAREEIFGPVLALSRADDFTHALLLANDSEFGLTGAVYSRDDATLEIARDEFHVGNLYFNRKCTGALVGAHPFGGFNMSGTDSKAGGADYLALFTQAKLVAKKLGTTG